jgi:antitoxin (DNA-binding transcriptional repressor) of toxin-antitoxin stability system
MLGDVGGEIAEAGKDRPVVRIVGAQRDAVALRDNQRDLEQIDRIQAEPFAEKRRGWDRSARPSIPGS